MNENENLHSPSIKSRNHQFTLISVKTGSKTMIYEYTHIECVSENAYFMQFYVSRSTFIYTAGLKC